MSVKKGKEKILQAFLESILDIKINSLNLDKNTELLPDFYDGKTDRLDVLAQLDDGILVDIEVKVNVFGLLIEVYMMSLRNSRAYGK